VRITGDGHQGSMPNFPCCEWDTNCRDASRAPIFLPNPPQTPVFGFIAAIAKWLAVFRRGSSTARPS
jgi:hypothetical protein